VNSMATPNALVIRSAGTNCDAEMVRGFTLAGAGVDLVHVDALIAAPDRIAKYDLIGFPGGFSYGDDVAAGKILANQMLHRLADPLNKFVADGKLMLGICNGFQVLIKSGLLPWGNVDPDNAHRDATLGWNDSGQFVDKWVHLRCDSTKCVFLPDGEVIALPIAHGEGKFVPRDDDILTRLRDDDQIALRYTDESGTPDEATNPNGSVDDIAGICDPTGRILGLMPHPERFVRTTQHPQWTRKDIKRPDGNLFFDGAMEFLK